MQLVETITVGSGGAASIQFSSIPQDATDLLLLISARSVTASSFALNVFRFNGDSSNSYAYRNLTGNGTAPSSSSNTAFSGMFFDASIPAATTTSNTFGNLSLYIPNYSDSQHKRMSFDAVGENNATAARQVFSAGRWASTSPITTITFTTTENLAQHTTASLYKIIKA
jgi:hypothetical protein